MIFEAPSTLKLPGGTPGVLVAVALERLSQNTKWGEQNHPDGTGGAFFEREAEHRREVCEERFREGTGAWSDILLEEVYEALAESDPAKLREELVQVAAVAVSWVEAIDRRRDTDVCLSPPCTSYTRCANCRVPPRAS